MNRFLKEPLVHFMALAVAVFAVYGLVGDRQERVPDRIMVSAPKIEQLAAVFAKTWQRAPTSEELKGIVDDYVKEEIYVREALALRLDEDDTVIRRRLRQKMEFLSAAEAESATPSDSELDSYLKANPHHFELESKVAFQQIFLSPDKHGDKLAKDAAALLDVLATNASVEPNTLGDPTLLPYELPLTGNNHGGADLRNGIDPSPRCGNAARMVRPGFLHLRISPHQGEGTRTWPPAATRRSA